MSGSLMNIEPRPERRLEKRIPCTLSAVRITAEGDLETVAGYVMNVSKSGVRLRTEKYFRCRQKVAVEIVDLLIRGSIRYRTVRSGHPESFEMGLWIDEVASF